MAPLLRFVFLLIFFFNMWPFHTTCNRAEATTWGHKWLYVSSSNPSLTFCSVGACQPKSLGTHREAGSTRFFRAGLATPANLLHQKGGEFESPDRAPPLRMPALHMPCLSWIIKKDQGTQWSMVESSGHSRCVQTGASLLTKKPSRG